MDGEKNYSSVLISPSRARGGISTWLLEEVACGGGSAFLMLEAVIVVVPEDGAVVE